MKCLKNRINLNKAKSLEKTKPETKIMYFEINHKNVKIVWQKIFIINFYYSAQVNYTREKQTTFNINLIGQNISKQIHRKFMRNQSQEKDYFYKVTLLHKKL